MAERDPTKKGASGKMSYYTCVAAPDRTNVQVQDQAKEYQSAGSLTVAKEIQKKNGVRYSELFRLPYFDMVKMLITDPMHTFILGMVQNANNGKTLLVFMPDLVSQVCCQISFFKPLSLLCEIVVHITKPIMSEEDIETLYRLIHEHHKRFAAAYGKWDISINYRMALHICDIISDYGPPHGYWCYAYERMNVYL